MCLERVQRRPALEPAFVDHVGNVVLLRPEEEMIGIAAGRHVAPVADTHALGDYLSIRCFPGKAMDLQGRALATDYTVAASIDGSFPQPTTTIWFWDKALLPRNGLSATWAVLGAAHALIRGVCSLLLGGVVSRHSRVPSCQGAWSGVLAASGTVQRPAYAMAAGA